jgi:hypothetical protein
MKSGSAQGNEMNVIINRNKSGGSATSPDAMNDATARFAGSSYSISKVLKTSGGEPDSSELSKTRIKRLGGIIILIVSGLLTARMKRRVPAAFGGTSARPSRPRNEAKAV